MTRAATLGRVGELRSLKLPPELQPELILCLEEEEADEVDGVILGVRLGDRRSLKLPPELHPELADPLLLSRKLISASFAHFRFNKELILIISPSSPASLHSIFKDGTLRRFHFFYFEEDQDPLFTFLLEEDQVLVSSFHWRSFPHFSDPICNLLIHLHPSTFSLILV